MLDKVRFTIDRELNLRFLLDRTLVCIVSKGIFLFSLSNDSVYYSFTHFRFGNSLDGSCEALIFVQDVSHGTFMVSDVGIVV